MFHAKEKRSYRLTAASLIAAHICCEPESRRVCPQKSAHLRYMFVVSTYHVQNFDARHPSRRLPPFSGSSKRALAFAPADRADLIILNTCTVTKSADQDARAAIRRIGRLNPSLKSFVTGCYAQRAPEEIAALAGHRGDWQLAQAPTRRPCAGRKCPAKCPARQKPFFPSAH